MEVWVLTFWLAGPATGRGIDTQSEETCVAIAKELTGRASVENTLPRAITCKNVFDGTILYFYNGKQVEGF